MPRRAVFSILIVALAVTLAVAWYAQSSRDGWIPCQDGQWDAERQTCVPDPSLVAP